MTATLKKKIRTNGQKMHFHEARKWNPKMKRFIYTEKNNIHIIDLIDTYSRLREFVNF
jgi:small subunit ribosomal protein S2